MTGPQPPEPKTLKPTAAPTGVQHNSETPLPQKPSFLFFLSTSVGVLVIILLAVSAYHGLTH